MPFWKPILAVAAGAALDVAADFACELLYPMCSPWGGPLDPGTPPIPSPVPSGNGGQCEGVAYNVYVYVGLRHPGDDFEYGQMWGGKLGVAGPIRVDMDGAYARVNGDRILTTPPNVVRIIQWRAERVDGQPDNCGNLPGEESTEPTPNPRDPFNPNNPTSPFNPTNPDSPFNPDSPTSPFNPTNPNSPFNPSNPESPLNPNNPNSPFNYDNPNNPWDDMVRDICDCAGGGGGNLLDTILQIIDILLDLFGTIAGLKADIVSDILSAIANINLNIEISPELKAEFNAILNATANLEANLEASFNAEINGVLNAIAQLNLSLELEAELNAILQAITNIDINPTIDFRPTIEFNPTIDIEPVTVPEIVEVTKEIVVKETEIVEVTKEVVVKDIEIVEIEKEVEKIVEKPVQPPTETHDLTYVECDNNEAVQRTIQIRTLAGALDASKKDKLAQTAALAVKACPGTESHDLTYVECKEDGKSEQKTIQIVTLKDSLKKEDKDKLTETSKLALQGCIDTGCSLLMPSDAFSELTVESQLTILFGTNYPKQTTPIWDIHIPNPIDNLNWCTHFEGLSWNRGRVYGKMYFENSRLHTSGYFVSESEARRVLGLLASLSKSEAKEPRITLDTVPKRKPIERQTRAVRAAVGKIDSATGEIKETLCFRPPINGC